MRMNQTPPQTAGSYGRVRRPGQEGLVLIIILWIVLVLTSVAAAYAYLAKVDYQVTKYYANSVKAEYMAKAGVNRAIIMLREDLLKDINDGSYDEDELIIDAEDDDRWEYDSQGEVWCTNPKFYEGIEIADGSFTVRVIDEGSKLDLNAGQADAEVWRHFLVILGMDEDDAGPIASAIVDWRDQDDKPTVLDKEADDAGAEDTEDTYYNPDQDESDLENDGPAYVNKNANFDMVDELLLVQGMTPEILYGGDVDATSRRRRGSSRHGRDEFPGLYDYVTCYNTTTRMNINTLTFEPLAALLTKIRDEDDAQDLAEAIIKYRDGSDGKPGGRNDRPMRTLDNSDGDDATLTEVDDFTEEDLTKMVRWRLLDITSDTFTIISTGEVDGVRKTFRVIVRREFLSPDSIIYEDYEESGEPLPELARVLTIAFSEEG